MKIVLCGAGEFLRDNENTILNLPNTEVIAVVDNSELVHGHKRVGCIVTTIDSVKEKYDYIVITSIYSAEIEASLIEKGIERKKILRYREYVAYVNRDNVMTSLVSKDENKGKSILAITPILQYNGACLALLYLLEALARDYFYRVCVAAPEYQDDLIEYANNRGISVLIKPNIEFDSNVDLSNEFDCCIVNTLLMRNCIKCFKDNFTLWWLHESKNSYEIEQKIWGGFKKEEYQCDRIFCVSEIERKTSYDFLGDLHADVMEYGLPDILLKRPQMIMKKKDKLVFAIIGMVSYIKGQDVFVNAIASIPEELRKKSEFWMIGDISEKKYFDQIDQTMKNMGIEYLGKKSHLEIEKLYGSIDVVVSASRQDSLPIVVTEGFMNSRTCIISDAVGTADYVENGIHAVLFRNEDYVDLARKMVDVIEGRIDLNQISKRGREIYDESFSVTPLAARVNKMILDKR